MLLPFLLAFFLGLKHSLDADHIIAVSNFVAREKYLQSAVRIGFFWAVGHVITASILTLALFTLADQQILARYSAVMEQLVGVMLIVLGLLSIRTLKNIHAHTHSHKKKKHTHLHKKKDDHTHSKVFGIGVFQGLASNDELLVLLTVAVSLGSVGAVVLGAVLFSMGVVLGMIGFSFLVNFPLKHWKEDRVKDWVIGAAATISILYGLFVLLASS